MPMAPFGGMGGPLNGPAPASQMPFVGPHPGSAPQQAGQQGQQQQQQLPQPGGQQMLLHQYKALQQQQQQQRRQRGREGLQAESDAPGAKDGGAGAGPGQQPGVC